MRYIRFDSINESNNITTKERNQLPDDAFGIPSLRKYPLTSKKLVLSAIKLFGHCPKEHEAELARNIIKKMKEYNISPDVVGENNRLRKYL